MSAGLPAARERAVRNYYRALGYEAIKVSDSAVVDVVAMRRPNIEELPLLKGGGLTLSLTLCVCVWIEVKCSALKRGPFADFPPAQRRGLIRAAQNAGATPILFWWPKTVGIAKAKTYPVSEWP